MKRMSFRNSSQLIRSILAAPPSVDTSIELSFSTFRSQDYHCNHFMSFPTDPEEQLISYQLDDLTQPLPSDESEDEQQSDSSRKGQSEQIQTKMLCFRNRKETIDRILKLNKGRTSKRPLTFRNKSSITSKYLAHGAKHT